MFSFCMIIINLSFLFLYKFAYNNLIQIVKKTKNTRKKRIESYKKHMHKQYRTPTKIGTLDDVRP